MATQFGMDDPFAVEQQRAQQSLKAAQEQQRYNAPQAPGMVGRVYVGTHPMKHLAEMLRVYQAGQKEKDAEAKLADVSTRRNKAMADTLRTYGEQMTGAPEQRVATQADYFDEADRASLGGNQDLTAVTPERKADPMAANQVLMQSQFPAFQQMGMTNLMKMPELEAAKAQREEDMAFKREEAQATRQARVDALNLQHEQRMQMLQEQRASREEMAAAQRQHQRDMANITAALRPAPAPKDPKIVNTDNGPMAYVGGKLEPIEGAPTPPKQSASANISYIADRFLGSKDSPGILDNTAQGGYFGLGGALGSGTQSAKEFDNMKEQLSTELRTMFRIPGEGALSDKEQAQYGIQLPDRGNSKELNKKILNDVINRAQSRVGGGQTPPATAGQTPMYATNGQQRIVSNDGGKTWQPVK